MPAFKLKTRELLIPATYAGPGFIGDTMSIIDERHPEYALWATEAISLAEEDEPEIQAWLARLRRRTPAR